MKSLQCGNFSISNHQPFVLIAGPCQVESMQHSLDMAGNIYEICKKLGVNFVYKSSFDKANRSSVSSKRGVSLDESLEIFARVKQEFACPIVTDVHEKEQCAKLAQVVDILQIPAFLCRQTDLLLAAGETGKIVKVKKGQFLAPWDVENIAKKIEYTGNRNIMFTERGTTFGYNNLINDMRGIKIMSKTGYPVIFDATHSVQQPGGLGAASGGQREMVRPLARAAVAVGVAGVFIETHQDPEKAPSDGPCMVRLDRLELLLEELLEFDKIAKKYPIIE